MTEVEEAETQRGETAGAEIQWKLCYWLVCGAVPGLAGVRGECSVHSGTFVVIPGRGKQGTTILHLPCKG